MSIAILKESIADFAKDIRLNVDSVLSSEGSPGLTSEQIHGIALACSYAVSSQRLADALREDFAFSDEIVNAAKSAATIMAMNNVYYRFLHLAEEKELGKMPARLRMNVIGKPGIPKVDFELMSLAVSAISGCGSCINAHVNEVKKAGVPLEGIQSTVKIASVINAAERALSLR